MKLSKLFTIGLLTTCSLFALSPARADDGRSGGESGHSDSRGGDDNHKDNNDDSHGNGNSGKSGGSSLPIDNQVWFLIIAAGLVGCKVIYNKSKTAAETADL